MVRHNARAQYFKYIKQDSPGDQCPHKKNVTSSSHPCHSKSFFVRNSYDFVPQSWLKVAVHSNLKGDVETREE
jgi:hypothetical protein